MSMHQALATELDSDPLNGIATLSQDQSNTLSAAETAKPALIEGRDFEAISSGNVVWVNDATGMCLGRFSAAGVDVHRTAAEQQAGLPQCLDCIHDLPFDEAWPRFQASMLQHHGIVVRDELRSTNRTAEKYAPSLSAGENGR